ncbi:hypothetical protein BCR39DRAFT_287489 [Naematelia encephala]|uniref:N-acetyltransferase domain-containing protein n=1 Tax=Naematelia encephala TaxID=71784 RepID=A0A1Y2ASB3_9TREE|nr:hypothetical protein BCR39DRAFT_287489 [Naematelia encephala]
MQSTTLSNRLQGVQWNTEHDEPYIFVNEHVRITPIRSSDVDMFVEHFNEPLVNGNPPGSPPMMTREKAAEGVPKRAREAMPAIDALRRGEDAMEACPFSIIRSYPEGAMMGYLGMHSSNHPLPPPEHPSTDYPWTNKTWDVWYNMSPRYTGKGYTKAAVKALIESYMAPIMRLTHVGAGVNVDHVVSRAILTGCGLQEEFRYERFRPNVDPIPRIKMVRRLNQSDYD